MFYKLDKNKKPVLASPGEVGKGDRTVRKTRVAKVEKGELPE